VKELRTARTTVLAYLCNTITHQPIELGSCSNPLWIQQVFYFKIEKKTFVLGVGFSLGDAIMRTCFRLCSQVYQALGTNPTGHFFGSSFLEFRLSSKSLEPLITLLAYLESKLWLKIQKLVKIVPLQMLTWDVYH